MSTMYSRSKVMFDHSIIDIGKVPEDDVYLDIACFETQQAIEFLLKAILLEEGVAYSKTHNIYRNINEEFLRRQAENNK